MPIISGSCDSGNLSGSEPEAGTTSVSVAGSIPASQTIYMNEYYSIVERTFMNEYCDYCGNEMEYIDSEWAKYNFSDSAEIVRVYGCRHCGKKWNKREGNFELDSEDTWEV